MQIQSGCEQQETFAKSRAKSVAVSFVDTMQIVFQERLFVVKGTDNTPHAKRLVSIVPGLGLCRAGKRKYTSVFTGILEYMQVHVEIHNFVKAHRVDIPGYTQIYSGIFVKGP